jgi:hypothetical protein
MTVDHKKRKPDGILGVSRNEQDQCALTRESKPREKSLGLIGRNTRLLSAARFRSDAARKVQRVTAGGGGEGRPDKNSGSTHAVPPRRSTLNTTKRADPYTWALRGWRQHLMLAVAFGFFFEKTCTSSADSY